MARMLNAHATRWQRETATYSYEVKGNLRAHEDRSWRREWAPDLMAAEDERHVTEWLKLTWWGRLALAGGTSS